MRKIWDWTLPFFDGILSQKEDETQHVTFFIQRIFVKKKENYMNKKEN